MDPNIDTYPIIDMYPKGLIMKKTTVGMPIFVVGTESVFFTFLMLKPNQPSTVSTWKVD